VIDTILGRFNDDLGPQAMMYRNHVYRGFNLHLSMSGLAESNELALAWVAHDLGLWTARTLNYLAPSVRLAEELAPEFQVELLNRKRWNTRVELATAIFEYLEIFHNRQRRHSSLGMLTPIEFEARRGPTTAA